MKIEKSKSIYHIFMNDFVKLNEIKLKMDSLKERLEDPDTYEIMKNYFSLYEKQSSLTMTNIKKKLVKQKRF